MDAAAVSPRSLTFLQWTLAYCRLACMTMFIFLTVILSAVGTPLALYSRSLWHRYSTFVQLCITPGFLCIPFSWVGMRLYMRRSGWLLLEKGRGRSRAKMMMGNIPHQTRHP